MNRTEKLKEQIRKAIEELYSVPGGEIELDEEFKGQQQEVILAKEYRGGEQR